MSNFWNSVSRAGRSLIDQTIEELSKGMFDMDELRRAFNDKGVADNEMDFYIDQFLAETGAQVEGETVVQPQYTPPTTPATPTTQPPTRPSRGMATTTQPLGLSTNTLLIAGGVVLLLIVFMGGTE